MEFNDIVYSSCDAGKDFAERLGFKRVLVLGKDIQVRDLDKSKDTNATGLIVIGSNKQRLEGAVKSGALAIEITDYRIDRKLMQTMREREVKLLISFRALKKLEGNGRQRALYMMSKLLRTAVKMRIGVRFASMADAKAHMFSSMQLIELAKLIGADESAARAGISKLKA